MIEFLDKIGVKAGERRSIIIFLLVVLVVGNVVWGFSVPKYFELKSDLRGWEEENTKLAQTAGPKKLKSLKSNVDTLKKEMGEVPDKKKAQNLLLEINSKARRSGLNFTRSRGAQGGSRNNKDFDEERRTVSFQSDLVDLVGFLKEVAKAEKSMIRVGSLNVQPTTDRKQLRVELTFVASYPKRTIESNPKSKN
tara:strand:+ start:2611 stop:3192 length:582 start_codon:yes stop_codon:yes gene_type:complete